MPSAFCTSLRTPPGRSCSSVGRHGLTVGSSNTTMSAAIPVRSRPRSTIFQAEAFSKVSLRTSSNAAVPAGLRICVNGWSMAVTGALSERRLIGALIWTPDKRGIWARAKSCASFRSKISSPLAGPATARWPRSDTCRIRTAGVGARDGKQPRLIPDRCRGRAVSSGTCRHCNPARLLGGRQTAAAVITDLPPEMCNEFDMRRPKELVDRDHPFQPVSAHRQQARIPREGMRIA